MNAETTQATRDEIFACVEWGLAVEASYRRGAARAAPQNL